MKEILEENVAEESALILGQIKETRSAIARVLFEIDDISLQLNPQIESDYVVKIGYLENELFQAQIAARRARRKASMAQARVNEGSRVDENECEATLNEEFLIWETQLQDQINRYMQVLEDRFDSRRMTTVQAKETKALHCRLVKRFHPDLNPGQNNDEKRFFLIAQGAFRAGDLDALRAIDAATEHLDGTHTLDHVSSDELYAEYELACAQLRVSERQLEEIKRANPYALKIKLANTEWVCRAVNDLKLQIEEQKKAKELYDERFRRLKEGGDYVE